MSDRGLVFIVDADADSAHILQEFLEGDGYIVVRAASGAEALVGHCRNRTKPRPVGHDIAGCRSVRNS